jgi:hypothetical protein
MRHAIEEEWLIIVLLVGWLVRWSLLFYFARTSLCSLMFSPGEEEAAEEEEEEEARAPLTAAAECRSRLVRRRRQAVSHLFVT